MNYNDLSKKQIVLIMSSVMLGVLLSALDSTIVGTAMPKIIQDLQGMEHYSWPFTAYMLCSTVAIPIFGKLADIFGRKLIYLIGLGIFLITSILCGLSQNMLQLIIFRGIQGIGGGILISNAFAIVGEIFSPRERGKYTGFVASMFGLANLVGPSVGGVITDALNWHWVFYVNIPLGIIAAVVIMAGLPSAIEHTEKRVVDYAGIAVIIAAFVPMLLAFSWAGRDYAWLSPQILGMLGFSFVMLAVFVLIESKVKEPIMPLHLFKSRTFNLCVFAAFLANAAMFGSVIYIPLYVQGVTGASATSSGFITTPMMLSFVVASILAGNAVSKTGKYKTLSLISLFVATIGMVLLSTINIHTPYYLLVTYMILLGAGLGANTPIFSVVVQNAFPMREIGMTTSAMQFFRNIGGTIGSAVLGSVLLSGMASGVKTIQFGQAPDNFVQMLKDPKLLSSPIALQNVRVHIPAAVLPFFDNIMDQVKAILSTSIQHIFWVGIGITLAAFAAIIFLKEEPLGHVQKSEIEPVETCDNC